MYSCHNCGSEVDLEIKIARLDTCPNCYADLHCCLNCQHHDPGAQNQCKEPFAGFVRERDKANFCHFFTYKDSTGTDRDAEIHARARLEDMFKKLK